MPSGPPLVVPGAGLLRLIWNYGASGAGGLNVLGVALQGTAVVNQTMANTLDTAIKAALTSSGIVAQLHTTTTLVAVGIRDIRAAHLTEFVGIGAAVAGTGTGDPLPRQVAFCVSLKTALSGPRYRGRVYLGGLTEGDNDTGANALAALATNGVAFVNAIDSALNGVSGDLAVVSRPAFATTSTITTINPAGDDEVTTRTTEARGGAVTPMTSVVARNLVWDSQRRRTSAGSVSTFFLRPVAFAEKGGKAETLVNGSPRHR